MTLTKQNVQNRSIIRLKAEQKNQNYSFEFSIKKKAETKVIKLKLQRLSDHRSGLSHLAACLSLHKAFL